MAGSNINQNIFNYGELSPELGGATDSELYNHGLEYCLNARIGTLGGIYKREGSYHIHRYIKYGTGVASGAYIRDLYSFNISQGVSYVLAISPFCIEIFNRQRRVDFLEVQWLTPEIYSAGYSLIQYGDDMYFFTKHGIYVLKYNINTKKLTLTDDINFSFAPVGLMNNEESKHLTISNVVGNSLTITANFENAFYASDVGQNIYIAWTITKNDEKDNSIVIPCKAYCRIETWLSNSSVNCTLITDKSTIGTDAALLPDNTFKIYDFALPVFGEGRGGYPTKACIFKGRLWIIDDKGFTIFASRINYDNILDFYQYAIKEGATESSLIYDMDPSCGVITWIAPIVDKLLIGTINGLFISNGRAVSGDKLVTWTSLSFTKVASVQCGFTRPAIVNSAVIFSDREGRLLYEVAVNDLSGMYDVNEISMASRHILNAGVSGSISYTTYPYNLIACPLKDGVMAVMTYSRGNEVYGWTRVALGGSGHVESCASLKYKGHDYIVMCVSRIKNGRLERTIEYFDNQFIAKPDDVLEHHYVDSGITYANKGYITNVNRARDAQIKFDISLRKQITGDNIYILAEDDEGVNAEFSRNDFDCNSLTHLIYTKVHHDMLDNISNVGGKVLVFVNSLLALGLKIVNLNNGLQLYLCSRSKIPQDFLRKIFTIYVPDYNAEDEDQWLDLSQYIITTNIAQMRRLMLSGRYERGEDGWLYEVLSYTNGTKIEIDDQNINDEISYDIEKNQLLFYEGKGDLTAGRYLSIGYKLQDDIKKYHYKKASDYNISSYNASRILSMFVLPDNNGSWLCSFNTSSHRVCLNNELPISDDITSLYPNLTILATLSMTEWYCASRNVLLSITYQQNDDPNLRGDSARVVVTLDNNEEITRMFQVSNNAFYLLTTVHGDINQYRIYYFLQKHIISFSNLDLDDKIPNNFYHSGGVIFSDKYVFYYNETTNQFDTYNNVLGADALSVVKNDNMIYIGGRSGRLYKLKNQEWYIVNHNQRFNIAKIIINNNDNTLVCLSNIGEVLEFDMRNAVEDDNAKTIEYTNRSFYHIKSIGYAWYINGIQQDTSHICVVNRGILADFVLGNGYTNILEEKDFVYIKDIQYMPTINNKAIFRVYSHVINNNTGEGTVLFDRFKGDALANEAYDASIVNNGEIYFPISNVPNLSRFHDETLRVVVNGDDIGDRTVVDNHILLHSISDIYTKNSKSFIAHVGYSYDYIFNTLDLAGGSVKGSSVGMIAQQHTICVQVLSSRGGEYSADGINWYPIIYSYITDKSLDHPMNLYTGKLKLVMPNSTVDMTARKVWFRHKTAEPFNILAITRDTYVSDI